ncbi:MAG: HAMP domain-containing histidine kinase [Cyclobacteriaceae bacterium]|nr:HAMP domain-containing histidine kinase [Cyclobacteriaceae bacterium]
MENTTVSSDQKASVLIFRLNTLLLLAIILFFLLDNYYGSKVPGYVYLGFLLFTLYNYFVLYKGYINLSKVTSLLFFNLLIFLVASSEPYETGLHFQFVAAGAVALALYGYKQLNWAIGFVLLSLVLDLVTFKTDIHFLPVRDIGPNQAAGFAVLNTVIASVVSVYTILFISKFNYDSEEALKQKDKLMGEQNEQLLKTNAELDRFVYSASHDLRAPLSSIKGLVDLIERSDGVEETAKFLNLIRGRIDSMNEFISEIVNYSRNSRLEIEKKEVQLHELLKATYEELQFMPGWEKIEVIWECPGNIEVLSDPMRLKMVFSNLLSNAIKYSDLDKENSWVKVSSLKNDEHVIVRIEDNGLGIPEHLQPNIFDMFFRAHADSSGSGLGLYISMESIAKLSGNITLQSVEGKGSMFDVAIPIAVE